MATSTTTSSSVKSVGTVQPREPTLEDVYNEIFSNQYIIPAFYLLDTSKNFISEKRVRFTNSTAYILPFLTDAILKELNFLSAPADIVEHYLYPDGPLAIFVGGQAMNIYEDITVPSADLDIDLIPLVNRSVSSTSATTSSSSSTTTTTTSSSTFMQQPPFSVLPLYTAEHKLQPLYQKYFDWLLNQIVDIIENHTSRSNDKLLNTRFEEMIKSNIDSDTEVKLSKRYNRKLGYIPGEVLQVKTIGLKRFVIAEIINESFFSKIAIWIRENEEVEKIVEFKLLNKLPELNDYTPIDKSGIFARPTVKKFIENGIETLTYRIAQLQRDLNLYTTTIKQLMILPEPSILDFEESIRKKIVLSAMRINDIIDRLIQLFNKLDLSKETLELLTRFLLVFVNNKQNVINPTLINNIAKIYRERFPKLADNPSTIQMFIWFENERKIINQMFSVAVKDLTLMVPPMDASQREIFIKTLQKNYPLFKKFTKNNPKEIRMKLYKEEKLLEEEAAKSMAAVTTANKTITTSAAVVQNSGNSQNRSSSPALTNNSEKNEFQNKSEQVQQEQKQEAEEVFAAFNSKGKNTEVLEKIDTILKRQQLEKAERNKKRKELEKEAKLIKQQKQLERLQAEKAQKAKSEANNEAALKELAEQRNKDIEGFQKLREARRVFFYCESPSFYPNNYLSDVYETFMPAMFFGDKAPHKLLGFQFPDNISVNRAKLFSTEEIKALPAEDQEEPPTSDEFEIQDQIYEITVIHDINDNAVTVLLFTFSDLDIKVIQQNFENTTKYIYNLAELYNQYMLRKRYASAYSEKLLNEFVNPLRGVKQKILEIGGQVQALSILESLGPSKKKEVITVKNEIFEAFNTIYKNILNLCVIFQEFLFNIVVACTGSDLPTPPTIKEFTAIYKPLLNITMGEKGKRKLLSERIHRDIFDFTQKVIIYNSICSIERFNNMKLNFVKREKYTINPPYSVLTTMPSPFRNQIETYSSTTPELNYVIFENLYTKMKEYNFSFFEYYPLYEAYIEKNEEFVKPFNDLLIGLSPMKQMKMKQALEITLDITAQYWNNFKENYGGEIQKNLFKRLNAFLIIFMKQNYVLNAKSIWRKINAYIENTNELTIKDIAEIASIMITKLKRYYVVRFYYLPSILDHRDKTLRNLPYSRYIDIVKKEMYAEIETYLQSKAKAKANATTTTSSTTSSTNSSSSSSATENKKGGKRYLKTQKKRRNSRKTRKSKN